MNFFQRISSTIFKISIILLKITYKIIGEIFDESNFFWILFPLIFLRCAQQCLDSGTCTGDTIFVIDSSGSVRKVFKRQVKYVENVVELLDVSPNGDHVALFVFSGTLRRKMKYSFGDKQTKNVVLKRVRGELNPFFHVILKTYRVVFDYSYFVYSEGNWISIL